MRWTVLLLTVLTIAGCSTGGSGGDNPDKKVRDSASASKDPAVNLPKYDVTKEEDGDLVGQSVKNYSVFTDVTSEKDLRTLTEFFGSRNPEKDAVVASFYLNQQGAELSGTGFVFSDKEAAQAILANMYPQGADVDSEVQKAMNSDGIYIVSIADEVREATENMP
jgi:hypothetical protein